MINFSYLLTKSNNQSHLVESVNTQNEKKEFVYIWYFILYI